MTDDTTDTSSDEALALLTQQGHNYAFGMLVVRYQQKLTRYGRRFLASSEDIEDVVQDVFLKAYQNIRSFDAGQRFSPWIYRIAHNTFVNALRKKTHSPVYVFDLDAIAPHALLDDEQEMERERDDMHRMLDKALAKLTPKYREILVLHYIEELPYTDIAEVLQVPLGTVGVRLKRAREALRTHYSLLEQ